MFGIASTTEVIATMSNDIGTVLSLVLISVLTTLIGLLMLGYGVRSASKHIFETNPYDKANWDVYMKTNYPW